MKLKISNGLCLTEEVQKQYLQAVYMITEVRLLNEYDNKGNRTEKIRAVDVTLVTLTGEQQGMLTNIEVNPDSLSENISRGSQVKISQITGVVINAVSKRNSEYVNSQLILRGKISLEQNEKK
ncbi:hypothetical protein [Limosilactobacillus agrestis]|uniref:hypothetical protein n=1 Tax=Limosilactobacillus agrestis TaxID=2759748 RepID=UPI001E4DE899|nr:hypothetical protein [Limosilactobacillus agrestis]MCD7112058.1 hypothetical protein [Limosilactobacillus agrestis]